MSPGRSRDRCDESREAPLSWKAGERAVLLEAACRGSCKSESMPLPF